MGHEKTLTGLIPALAGADMIYGPGMLESGITFDFSQLVLDCEFVRMIKFVLGGVSVTEETLALDALKAVGSQGDFLGNPHTFQHMTQQSRSELIDRRIRGKWEKDGATDSYTRASQKARYILENHEPEPLPEPVLKQVRQIVVETDREMGVG
jgi:trimethylamine--corrinoid protein Co-methyltransferase